MITTILLSAAIAGPLDMPTVTPVALECEQAVAIEHGVATMVSCGGVLLPTSKALWSLQMVDYAYAMEDIYNADTEALRYDGRRDAVQAFIAGSAVGVLVGVVTVGVIAWTL